MGYRVRAARIDANQNEIVRYLRTIPGCTVAITSMVGNGFPDIVVGYQGSNYLLEIKDSAKPPSKQLLTPAENKFHNTWRGQVDIVKTFEECLEVMDAIA